MRLDCIKYLYFRTNRYNADRFDTFEDDNYESDDIDEFINDEEESDESEVCPFMKHKQHVCMYSGFLCKLCNRNVFLFFLPHLS